MKRSIFLIIAILLTTANLLAAEFNPGKRELFNDGWIFIRYFYSYDEKTGVEKEPSGLQNPSADDSGWQNVTVPHDWAITGPFNDTLENNTALLPWKGIGWYRKHFRAEEYPAGTRTFIEFDGAMANARVWLNGIFIGEWPYGYTSFRLDVTRALKPGADNVIAVRLDTKNWDSRWYPGAGLYRNVWIVRSGAVHFGYNGVFCTTPEIKNDKGRLNVSSEIENVSDAALPVTLDISIYRCGKNGVRTGDPVAKAATARFTVPAGGKHDCGADILVNNPALWDIDDPNLYMAVAELKSGDAVTDTREVVFGFRTVVFTPRDGMLLNGRRVDIKGVCNHHDLGALGAAFNTRAAERQLELLKEMGCNAIRTSHNPPAPELLDLCDRMGFLVQDEAFDAWRKGKKPKDYNILYTAWHEADLRAMVRRDRNHPSVIIWSIGNEVPDQGNFAMAENLKRIVKSEDYTRPVTSGCDNPASGTSGFQLALDIFGINYRLKEYDKFFAHAPNSNLPFHASESASTVSSRGEYFFPVVEGNLNENLPGKGICHVSSYDLAYPWWASTPDQQWAMNDKYPAVFGEFVWTGFDYLGEPTPYGTDITDYKKARNEESKEAIMTLIKAAGTEEIPSRSSYFGIFDLAGFKKDRFWLYQSKWRPDFPSAHILPHWNWPERKGLVTPVHVYTSGDEAELFLNGVSQGRRTKGTNSYRLVWNEVLYQPGELRVIAYKNGVKWAEESIKTTGKASSLELKPDRNTISSDGYDLTFITVSVKDRNGLAVPGTSNRIKFTVSGPGEIVATDNGDPTSHESFQSPSKKAFNGLCLVIVKAKKGQTGSITVKADSEGLKGSTTEIEVKN